MKKHSRKFCAATIVAAVLFSALPIVMPIAYAGWGSVIGSVIGDILNRGGGSSGGNNGSGNGGGALGGLSNQKHAHPNPNDHEKLFILAVEKNDIGTVSEMLNAGVDINGVYPGTIAPGYTQGRTALSIAVFSNNHDIMQLLLENGADPNGFYTYDNKHVSYLERIVHSSLDADLVEYLINWGADVNGYTNSDKNQITPIFACAARHRISQDAASALAQILIEHGAFLESKDSRGYTPFLKAIDMDSYRMIDVLADGGANLNAKNKQGKNALQIALDKNDLQLYKHIQDIMERGQQPSKYQSFNPQTQRRTTESVDNASSDDELVTFENQTNKKARIQELNNFNDVVIKATRAERKAYEPYNTYTKEHPDTIAIADRSKLFKDIVDALKQIKVSLEPQALLSDLEHVTFDEKEICSDLLQVMNTRYDKMIESYSLFALNRDLTSEELQKAKVLQEEIQSLGQSVIDISGRVDKISRQ